MSLPAEGGLPGPAEPADGGPGRPILDTGRYSRWAGVVALVLVALIAVNTLLSTPRGSSGVKPGRLMPPFAVPLAASTLNGDANVASRAGQGKLGREPACSVRGPRILNICEVYERGPVVLVMFVAASDCTHVLGELQGVLGRYPGLRAAGVAIRGDRSAAARQAAAVAFPIGFDRDGAVADAYNVAACPQVTFAYPGGVIAGHALLHTPSVAQLEARLADLYHQSLARGWRPPRT
jgi:hypothetical protein